MVNNTTLAYKLLAFSLVLSDRQPIHDRTASRTEWDTEYDFIVVGAGAAGCVVANRLAANPNITVLLLEAGGAQDAIYNDIPTEYMEIPHKRRDLQWFDYTTPQIHISNPGRRLFLTSGKALGGSTTHNQMIYSRGNPKDYDQWSHVYGAKGWNFSEVLPFFIRFEKNNDQGIVDSSPGWHGTDGPIEITTPQSIDQKLLRLKSVYNSLGFKDTDVNGPNQSGVMIGQSFIGRSGLRSSAANSYIDPNPYPNNLHIVTKALVTKILFNGLTAVGVQFERNDSQFNVSARKEIIISAGAIRSPQILMLSGVGPKDHLNEVRIPVLLDLPVGNNYQNHPAMYHIGTKVPGLTKKNLDELNLRKSGPLSKLPFIIGFVSTGSNEDKEWPNASILSFVGMDNRLAHIMYLGRVRSTGTIRLNSGDPRAVPLINPNIFSDPKDYSDFFNATKFLLYLSQDPSLIKDMSVPSLKRVRCASCVGKRDYDCEEGVSCYLRKYTKQMAHPSGSCRMGAEDRDDVVVDPQLKVKNTKNLRVCDASIYPVLPNGNTYAPTAMVGEKCVQMIKDFHNI